MLISPRFSFNWSGDSGGSTTDGCAITGICSLDFIFDKSAVGSTTVCCATTGICVFDFSLEMSAVGSTTCGANCGILSCDNWRDDAAIGCPGIVRPRHDVGQRHVVVQLHLGRRHDRLVIVVGVGGTDRISCFASLGAPLRGLASPRGPVLIGGRYSLSG